MSNLSSFINTEILIEQLLCEYTLNDCSQICNIWVSFLHPAIITFVCVFKYARLLLIGRKTWSILMGWNCCCSRSRSIQFFCGSTDLNILALPHPKGVLSQLWLTQDWDWVSTQFSFQFVLHAAHTLSHEYQPPTGFHRFSTYISAVRL